MFLFFKQKTAYELRISDWSSDVCSSDLNADSYQDHDREALRKALQASRYPWPLSRGQAQRLQTLAHELPFPGQAEDASPREMACRRSRRRPCEAGRGPRADCRRNGSCHREEARADRGQAWGQDRVRAGGEGRERERRRGGKE